MQQLFLPGKQAQNYFPKCMNSDNLISATKQKKKNFQNAITKQDYFPLNLGSNIDSYLIVLFFSYLVDGVSSLYSSNLGVRAAIV